MPLNNALIGTPFGEVHRRILYRGLHCIITKQPLGCAFALYVVIFNLLGLTQVFIKGYARFTQVAFGNSLPGAIFIQLLLLLAATHHATVSGLLAAYLASWCVTLAILPVQAFRRDDSASATPSHAAPTPLFASTRGFFYIATGWPVVINSVALRPVSHDVVRGGLVCCRGTDGV